MQQSGSNCADGCLVNSSATRCSGSQNCCTRPSGITAKRGAAWRPPVRYQDGLPKQPALAPFGLDAEPTIAAPRRPPQTKWSSGRRQQDQSRDAGLAVERLLELAEICAGKREERLLTSRHRRRTQRYVPASTTRTAATVTMISRFFFIAQSPKTDLR